MIREMTKSDFEAFWPCFETVIQAQETYAFDPKMSFEEAYELWCIMPMKTFVFEENQQILGSYYIKPNAMGPGNHVCNCGYMVTEAARGKGIAKRLCEHSQDQAMTLGFEAMQFNAVVSSNEVAVQLWQKLGFKIIGTIPRAYRHGKLGHVDSYIMYKALRA
ncbi:ribosomal-protein-alanine acetyltransferase [Nitrincola nitratireducens]|uniref:Ribosomal-protein-alanine acetyltransferase n=2 Tax=Oceanospirillaceae TaxID=135620 RepID=W9V2V4_9GAMM|nr:ribosomal-protein-alanine acetyltransferase [Nitrincola nitratireducens]